MTYAVQSTDKDWAFVTASVIDERVRKVTRYNAATLFTARNTTLFMPMIFTTFMLVTLFFATPNRQSRIDALNRARAEATDITDFIYRVRLQEIADRASEQFPGYVLGGIVGLVLLFAGSLYVVQWLPAYVFYWGDQVARYQGKLTRIRFVVSGVILTIVLGIVANFFSSRLF